MKYNIKKTIFYIKINIKVIKITKIQILKKLI